MDSFCQFELGDSPFVAAAVHDGHNVRDEVAELLALDPDSRRREEDPYTGAWTAVAPTRVVGLRSRFEVDLNRPRDKAFYARPEDAWGLQVWKRQPSEDFVGRSLQLYDEFYRVMHDVLSNLQEQHGRFLIFDLHSYNHRRQGPGGPHADHNENPQVNIGTGTMADRQRWGPVIDRFIDDLRTFDFPGGRLDVRENVKFFGGGFPRWVHQTFPDSACVLSIEFKKFFMDEWTGEPDEKLLSAIGDALQSTVPGTLAEFERA